MYLYGHAIKAYVVVVFRCNLLMCLFRYLIICPNFWSFCVVLFSAARCPDSALRRRPRLSRDLIKVPVTVA